MEWLAFYIIQVFLALVGAFSRLLLTKGWKGFSKKDVLTVAAEFRADCVLIGILFWIVVGLIIFLIFKVVRSSQTALGL